MIHPPLVQPVVGLLGLLAVASGGCGATTPASDSRAPADNAHRPDGPTPLDARSDSPGAGSLDSGVPDGPLGDLLADGAADAAPSAPWPPPSLLPFTYTRPAKGKPVSKTELEAITDLYYDLLTKTRYFDVLDERVHGWPQSDPQKRYWYGTFWSGVSVIKKNGEVTYVHDEDGSDNNGLRTGPLMEGVCFAYLTWKQPKHELLLRKIVRGFISWIRAMERYPGDTAGPLLSRSAYPPSITSTDGGRKLHIDYSKNRPGINGEYSEYVQLKTNPVWGDLYTKNKRSKDDIGQMLRAIAQVESCLPYVADPETLKEIAELRTRYTAWSKKVEDDGFRIATLDKQAKPYFPIDTLANYYTQLNIECNAVLGIRMMGRTTPGTWDCGNGIGLLDPLWLINDHTGEMLYTAHEAAVTVALLRKQISVAKKMAPGLAARVEGAVKGFANNNPPKHMDPTDLAAMITYSATAGVPLNWDEVRFMHARIKGAHAFMTQAKFKAHYDVFNPSTPDGTYYYKVDTGHLRYRGIGPVLGTCSGRWRNTASMPVLDCARLRAKAAP